MAVLTKTLYTSGSNRTIVWESDLDGIMMVEHWGTMSGTAPTAFFAHNAGLTPRGAGVVGAPFNSEFVGSLVQTLLTDRIRVRRVSGVFNALLNTKCEYYACWIKAGSPTVASSGTDELTVGSNGNGYYAEFRKSSDLKRVVCAGARSGSAANNPAAKHTTPVSMITSDFPCYGNIASSSNFPFCVNMNATSSTQFEFICKNGFAGVTNSFYWVTEYIKGS